MLAFGMAKKKGDKNVLVTLHKQDLDLIAKEMKRHAGIGSRTSRMAIIRYCIREALKEDSKVPPMPRQD